MRECWRLTRWWIRDCSRLFWRKIILRIQLGSWRYLLFLYVAFSVLLNSSNKVIPQADLKRCDRDYTIAEKDISDLQKQVIYLFIYLLIVVWLRVLWLGANHDLQHLWDFCNPYIYNMLWFLPNLCKPCCFSRLAWSVQLWFLMSQLALLSIYWSLSVVLASRYCILSLKINYSWTWLNVISFHSKF